MVEVMNEIELETKERWIYCRSCLQDVRAKYMDTESTLCSECRKRLKYPWLSRSFERAVRKFNRLCREGKA